MSALTFSLKKPLRFPVNCAQLTPQYLNGKSHLEIASFKLSYGNQLVDLGDLFDVSGTDAVQIHFKNAMPMLEYLGADMNGGGLTIEGDAGAHLGFGMRQGRINCLGDSGDYAACNMSGGLLKIKGNTGHFLGAAAAGLRKGMRGGTVIVQGNAGDRVGDQMRRGLILIAGNAGDYCGSRMIAGTIGVWGNTGQHLGFSMQRGTLLVVKPFTVSPTIQDCGAHTLPFLNLLFKSFQSFDTPFKHITSQRVQRYVGDLACNGNGEILYLLRNHQTCD